MSDVPPEDTLDIHFVGNATLLLRYGALTLLTDHLHHCVSQAAQGDGEQLDDKIREASAAIARLVKS